MSRRIAAPVALAALVGLAACEHARPFSPGAPEPNVPFASAYPRQLTFSASGDVEPAWLPGDSGIIYAFSSGRPNLDQCLGVLPAAGGHLVQVVCHDLADPDSTSLLREPAVGSGGRLAYLRESSPIIAAAPVIELVVASLAAPDPGRVVLRYPYTDAGSVLHGSAGSLRWLPDGALVYIAEQLTFTTPPLPVDTIATPLWIEQLDLVGDTGIVTVVPGTAGATSLAVDSAGALYFTLPGDSVVYRLPPGEFGSSPSPWYDFGAAGAASGVQVHGNLLVAVVADTELYQVDVAANTRTRIAPPDSQRLSQPALSPSGTRLVVQGVKPGIYPDLWLYQLP